MKKNAILVGSLMLLLLLMSSTVSATPPEYVQGTTDYIAVGESWKVAGGNIISEGKIGEITWTGTPGFNGTGTCEFRLVEHGNDAWVRTLCQFNGSLFGRTGGLDIQYIGKNPAWGTPAPNFTGTWTILGGTGGLLGAQGQGTWSGPGSDENPETPDFFYEGEVHIEPN